LIHSCTIPLIQGKAVSSTISLKCGKWRKTKRAIELIEGLIEDIRTLHVEPMIISKTVPPEK
jgi:hypothetical protein